MNKITGNNMKVSIIIQPKQNTAELPGSPCRVQPVHKHVHSPREGGIPLNTLRSRALARPSRLSDQQ